MVDFFSLFSGVFCARAVDCVQLNEHSRQIFTDVAFEAGSTLATLSIGSEVCRRVMGKMRGLKRSNEESHAT